MPREYIRRPVAERFWEKVNVDPDGCWLWTGAIHTMGYGVMQRGGRGEGIVRAHRVSWELQNGAIPDGLCVLHRCDVRACVRPDHLFLGTMSDNSRDMSAKRRGRNQYGGVRLRAEDVVAIRRSIRARGDGRRLARQYGVCPNTIYNIWAGRSWRHI